MSTATAIDPPARLSWSRVLVVVWVAVLVAVLAFTAMMGITGSRVAAALVAALGAGLAGTWAERLAHEMVGDGTTPRGLRAASGVGAALALVQLARLAVFMVAPTQTAYSVVPSSTRELQHSCLSSYVVAGQAAARGENIYDESLYSLPRSNPQARRQGRSIGPFKIDQYEYPPPFLLLPRALNLLAPDFMRMRMLWYGLDVGLILVAMVVVARLLEPAAAQRALLLAPLLFAGLPMLSTLQKGNLQIMVIAASLLAMVLFERRRYASGGALLAFATVSKLYPGLLVLYLLFQRRWRPAAWTAALSLVLVLLTLVDLGWAPFAAFLSHLPGLLGGEAFPAFRNPGAMAINLSIPGLAFKLGLFGVAGVGFGVSKIIGWIYTLVLLGVVFWIARHRIQDTDKPLVWMTILVLATLRSPFLPWTYGNIPPLWLLLLLVAAWRAPSRKNAVLVVFAAVALFAYWPMDWPIDLRLLAAVNGVALIATLGVSMWALRRAAARARSLAIAG